jgi:integrase
MATWQKQRERWVSTKMIDGERKFFYSKVSEEEADRLAREYKPTPIPIFEGGTFASFVYGPWKANTWDSLRPMSQKKYNGQLKAHILPVLGHLRLSSIGLDEMLALKTSLTLHGKKRPGEALSNRTAHFTMTLTLSILKMAKEAGKTQREDWRLVKLPKIQKKKKRQELPETFTSAMLKASEGHWMAGPLFAALFLGLRRGEVCGLKWSAIDRKNMRIRIDSQRQRQSGRGTVDVETKGEPRDLHVDQDLIAWMDHLGDKGSIYVFTGAEKHPMRPDRITQAMSKLCAKAEVPAVTFHDLRSYAASNLAALGVDLTTIMSILGHTKIDVTLLYVNSQKEQVRNALAGLLSSGIGGQKTG